MPEVLEERREVRPRAERAERERLAGARRLLLLGSAAQRVERPRARGDAHALLRIGDVVEHLVDHGLERVRPAGADEPARVAVAVEIDDGFAAQLVGVRLGPFGRADQALLLAVPGGEHQGAARAEALARELADRLRFGHQRDHPAGGIGGAVDPRVVVVAAHDPLIGQLGAGKLRDHVVDRHQLPVERELQADLGRPRSEVIRDRQRAAPRRRHHRAAQVLEQRLRVARRDRQHRDLGQHLELRAVEPLGILGRAHAWRQRIAGVHRHVDDRSALRALRRPEPARRVGVAGAVAVLGGVREDEAADRAVLGRDLGLDAAPRSAVASERDLALDVDAAASELLVVLGHAVVDVDDLGGDVAVDRVGVEGRELLRGLARGRVLAQRILDQAGRELLGRDHLDPPFGGSGEERLELFDRHLVAPRAEQLGDVLGVGLGPRRAQMMRARGEAMHPGLEVGWVERRVEALFERELLGGARRGEAEEVRGVRRRRWWRRLRADGAGGGEQERRREGDRSDAGGHGWLLEVQLVMVDRMLWARRRCGQRDFRRPTSRILLLDRVLV